MSEIWEQKHHRPSWLHGKTIKQCKLSDTDGVLMAFTDETFAELYGNVYSETVIAEITKQQYDNDGAR